MNKAIILSGILGLGTLFAAGESNEKADRYHALLLKRPDSATLFERFVDAWLDTGSKDELEAFLRKSAEGGGGAEWRLLGAYQEWMGQEEEAVKSLDKALELSPAEGGVLMARAKLKARMLDFEGALKDLADAGEAAGEEGAALKGTWLARSGRPAEAVEAWKEILKARPDDEELREDLIELEVGEGLYEEAIATGRDLVAGTKDPYQKALRLMRVAAIEVTAGKRDEGLKTYREVLRMTGEDSWLEREALAQVEKVYRRDQDVAGLRNFYQTLREEFPQRVSLRKGLAAQMAANGEVDEAVALFREILKITPGDMKNREEFVALLEGAGKFKEAMEELSSMVEEGGNQPELWERMARLADAGGDAEGLKNALAKLKEQRAEAAPGLVAVASLYERYKMPADAEAVLREAVENFPDAPEAKEALAVLLAGLDDEAKGKEATAIWLGMAEDADAEALLRVSRSLLANRRAKEAYELLESRIEGFPGNALLLNQLCQAAQASDAAEKAFPRAMQLTRLAETATDLEGALKVVGTLGRQLDLETVIAGLREGGEKSLVDWCVISELESLRGDLLASDAALAEAQKMDDGLLVASQRVRVLERRGDFEAAVAAQRDLLERPEGKRPIHLRRLVELLQRAELEEKALAEVEEWKRMAPGDKAAWMKRADLLGALGRPEEAVSELRRALAKFGDEVEIRTELARALVMAGDDAEGERIYRKLYEEATDAVARDRWIAELADLARREGRVENLVSEFERRKRTNSREVEPLLALAKIHEELRDYGAQREALAEALRRKPQDLKLRKDLARVEENSGDVDAALATLQEAVRLDPGPTSRQALAELCFRNGEIAKGLDALRGYQMDDARAIEQTVWTLALSNEWEMALGFLDQSQSWDWRLGILRTMGLFATDREEEGREILRSLATTTDEIEGVKPLIDETELSRWMDWMERQGHGEDLRLAAQYSSISQTAEFFHSLPERNSSHNSWSRSYGNYGGMPQMRMPGTAEEARLLAIAWLACDASNRKDEEKKELWKRIPFPQTPFFEPIRHQHEMAEWVQREIDAGRLTLDQAVARMGGNDDFPVDLLKKAVAELGESKAEAAEAACQALLQREPTEVAKWIQEWVDIVGHLEPSEREQRLQTLASICLRSDDDYSSYYYNGVEVRATRGTKETIRSLLREALESPVEAKDPKDLPNVLSQRASWLAMLMRDAWKRGAAEEAAGLINRLLAVSCEIDNLPANNGRRQSYNPYAYRYGSSSQTVGLMPPTFPNQNVFGRGYAGTVLSLFQGGDSQNDPFGGGVKNREFYEKWLRARQEMQDKDPDAIETYRGMKPEDFAGQIEGLDDVVVRVMALDWCDSEEKLAEQIGILAESEDKDLVMTAAGYYAREENLMECYRLLEKARSMPMELAERKQLDAHLAAVGQALKRSGTPIGELEGARRAALRIRREIRDEDQQQQLILVLNELDLADEAERVRRAQLAVSSNPSSSRRNSQFAQVSTLVAEGNQDGAAREGLKMIRALSSRGNDDWQLRQAAETLGRLDLAGKVAELARPAEDASMRRQLEFARICELLNADIDILPLLRNLAEADPDNDEVRALLLKRLPVEELMEGFDDGLPREALIRLGQSLMNTVSREGDQGTLEDVNKVVELAKRIFDGLVAAASDQDDEEDANANVYGDREDLTWANPIFRAAVRSFGEESPGLASKPENGIPEPSLEAYEERIERVRAMLMAAVEIPELTFQAFQMMNGCQSALGLDDAELQEAAIRAMASKEDLRNTNSKWVVRVGNTTYGYGTPSEAGPMPDIWLIEAVAKSGDGEIRKRLLARMEEASPDDKASFDLARALAGHGEFGIDEAMTAWQDAIGEDTGKKIAAHAKVLRIAYLEGATTEAVGKLESEYLRLSIEQAIRNYETPAGFISLLESKRLTQGWPACRELLDEYFERSVGPRELWEEWARLRSADALPDELSRIQYTIDNFLSTALQSAASLDEFFYYVANPLSEEMNSYYVNQAFERNFPEKTAGAMLNALDASSFWDRSWQDFASNFDDGLFWNILTSRILDNSSNERGALQSMLEQSKGEGAFRRKLFAQGISRKSEGLLPLLEEEIANIRALPEKEGQALANLLNSQLRNLETADLSPELAAYVGEIRGDSLADLRKEVESMLEAGMADFHLQGNGRDTVVRLAVPLISSDPELAARFLAATLAPSQDIRQNRSRGTSREEYARYLFDELVRRFADQGGKPEDLCRFLALLEEHESSRIIGTTRNNYYLENMMSTWWDHLRETDGMPELRRTNDKGESVVLFANIPHWEGMAKSLGKLDEPTRAGVLGLSLSTGVVERWFHNMDVGEYLEWMDESGYREKEPELARFFLLSMCDVKGKEMPESAYPGIREAAAGFLADERIPIRIRLEGMAKVSEGNAAILTTPEVIEAMTVLMEKWTGQDRPFGQELFNGFLRVLVVKEAGLPAERWKEILRTWRLKMGNAEDPEFAKVALSLALRIGDEEETKLLFPIVEKPLKGNLAIMLELADAGQGNLAARLASMPGETSTMVPGTWTEQIRTSLAGLLPAIPDEKERYRVEVVVSSMEDGKDFEGEGRDARMLRLAGDFAEKASKVPPSRLQILARLAVSREATAVLKEEMLKQCARWSYVQTSDNDLVAGLSVEVIRSLLDTVMEFEMADGSLEEVDRQLSSLLRQMAVNDQYYSFSSPLEGALNATTRGFLAWSRDHAEEKVPEDLVAKSREWLRLALQGHDYNYYKRRAMVLAAFVAMHDGKFGELEDWVAQLEEKDRKQWNSFWDDNLLRGLEFWRQIPGWLDEDRADIRRAWFRKLLADPSVVGKAMPGPWSINFFFDRNILTADDLHAVLGDLPEDIPNRTKLRVEHAAFYCLRLKEEEEGLRRLHAIRDEGIAAGDAFMEHYARFCEMDYYAYYDPENWQERAEEVAKELDWEFVPKGDLERFQKKREEWQDALKKEQ